MTTLSHLDMFYETRFAVHVGDSNPSNSSNTELTTVPEEAEIRYEDSPDRYINGHDYDAPNGKGFETARFLVSRAILDPDATVVPA